MVPNPGIVMPMIPVRSSCSLSNVRTATSSASVESSPPEMPTTAFSQRVCTSRLASPCEVGHHHLLFEHETLRFAQDLSVFGDDAVPGEYQVSR